MLLAEFVPWVDVIRILRAPAVILDVLRKYVKQLFTIYETLNSYQIIIDSASEHRIKLERFNELAFKGIHTCI